VNAIGTYPASGKFGFSPPGGPAVGNDWVLILEASGSTGGGVVGHWSLDETSGNQALDSAGSNPGTLHNAPARVQGVSGSALSFNGSNQYVQMARPGPLGGSAVAASAWLRTTSTTEEVFFAYGSDAGNGSPEYFRLNVNMSGPGTIGVRTGGGRRSFNAPGILDGTWHLVVVQTGANSTLANLQVYLDGVLLTSTAENGAPSAQWNIGSGSPTIPITLGADVQGGVASFAFNGSIDEVQLFNRVLSASEIQALRAIHQTPPTTECRIDLPSCPNYPSVVGLNFRDDWQGASSNQARCMQRAKDYYDWCATSDPVTARYLSGGAVVQQTTYPN
jgi:hypothetical protein